MADDCQLVANCNSGRRRLRSADVDTIVPLANTRLADARLWNTLPAELRQPDIELVTLSVKLCDPGA